MTLLPARLHASTRRHEPLTTVGATGEVRVPLALYAVDDLRGTADLVMSRAEAQRLFTQLAESLGFVHQMPAPRGLEAVR
ncbi:hypothetical protein ACFV7R_07625 [Streptomyces sp. NPDC059866]|uniref:hypothetical protein n=1 Tax=Streptomyces sp. NPDC059866 TaxID=3346978 RepID=UPI003661991C